MTSFPYQEAELDALPVGSRIILTVKEDASQAVTRILRVEEKGWTKKLFIAQDNQESFEVQHILNVVNFHGDWELLSVPNQETYRKNLATLLHNWERLEPIKPQPEDAEPTEADFVGADTIIFARHTNNLIVFGYHRNPKQLLQEALYSFNKSEWVPSVGLITERDRLAKTIYESIQQDDWLTTVDGTPNVASYAAADAIIRERNGF